MHGAGTVLSVESRYHMMAKRYYIESVTTDATEPSRDDAVVRGGRRASVQ